MRDPRSSDTAGTVRSLVPSVALALLALLLTGPPVRAEERSFADPMGDVRVGPRDADDSSPASKPPADVLSFSLDRGATEAAVSATLAAEPDLQYQTAFTLSVRWVLEFDSAHEGPDAEVLLYTLGGSVKGFASRPDDGECGAEGRLDGRTVTVERIPVGCFGEADEVRFRVEVTYDDPNRIEEADVYTDVAPDEGLSEPVARAQRDGPRESRRISGGDRFGTAVAVSQARDPDGTLFRGVYLASGGSFADALAVAVQNVNTLLVPPCGQLPQVVADELERLTLVRVTALGGEAAVCGAMLDQAVAAAGGGSEGERLEGFTRYHTAAAVADRLEGICDDSLDCPATGDVYLARADDFPDALTAGAFEAGPLLPVPACGELPAVIGDALGNGELSIGRIIVLGGVGAVCPDVVEQARAALPDGGTDVSVTRFGGGDRIETALAVSQGRHPNGAVEVALATASDFPDALTGGSQPLGPVLLVPDDCSLPQPVSEEIARLNPTTVFALGGEAAVCGDVLEQAIR